MMKTDDPSNEISHEVRTQTKDVTETKYDSFEPFNLKKELLLGMAEMDFRKPTPVQEESIPLIIKGKSIIARAKNGTGKTGAFLIPIINQINTESKKLQDKIDIISVRPCLVTTAGTFFTRHITACTAEQSVRGVLKALGKTSVTEGHWTHTVQSWGVSLIGQRILLFFGQKQMLKNELAQKASK